MYSGGANTYTSKESIFAAQALVCGRSTQKDVTEMLRRQVRDLPLIALPSPSYSVSFGGDPVPGAAKQLKVQYRIDGKAGEATFPEDALVMLPMPQ